MCLLLGLSPLNLTGQQGRDVAGKADEMGLDREQWDQIRERWSRSQPVIMLTSYEGDHLSGQPIFAGVDTLYFYASTNLPVGTDYAGQIYRIPITDIDKVLIQKGGNWLTRSNRSAGYQIPAQDRYFSQAYKKVKKSAVYRDSLVRPLQLKEAFPHSPVLRQVFPQKHLRISVSVGLGGDGVPADSRAALEASNLPSPQYGYETYAALEFFDLSWRFMNRIIVGGQLLARNTSSTLFADDQGTSYSNQYYYEVNYLEHRIYAEYAFFHVDRYFTKRWELLAGAGILMGRPTWGLYYMYDEYSDPDNPVYGSVTHEQADPLTGFQLRTSFHYYLFPGFSLWSGLEANISRPWTIQEVEVPSNNPSVPFVLQEHGLSFNSLRFKLGVSIYL
jgi:hypothetical protein